MARPVAASWPKRRWKAPPRWMGERCPAPGVAPLPRKGETGDEAMPLSVRVRIRIRIQVRSVRPAM